MVFGFVHFSETEYIQYSVFALFSQSEYIRYSVHFYYSAQHWSIEGHAQHNDYMALETYFGEMDKRYRNACHQVTSVKVREEFGNDWDAYRRGRNHLNELLAPVKEMPEAQMREFGFGRAKSKVLLESIVPKLEKFERDSDDLFGSLKKLKKASRSAGKNLDDILVNFDYDAAEDDLYNIESAANRLRSAVERRKADLMDDLEEDMEPVRYKGTTPATLQVKQGVQYCEANLLPQEEKFTSEHSDQGEAAHSVSEVGVPMQEFIQHQDPAQDSSGDLKSMKTELVYTSQGSHYVTESGEYIEDPGAGATNQLITTDGSLIDASSNHLVVGDGALVSLVPQENGDTAESSGQENSVVNIVTSTTSRDQVDTFREIVTVLDRNFRRCLIFCQKVTGQLMGNLPEFRGQPCSPFSHSTLDLIRQIMILDSVVKGKDADKWRNEHIVVGDVCLLQDSGLGLMKGAEYLTRHNMNDLYRHISSLIVIAHKEIEQMKPFGGECELE